MIAAQNETPRESEHTLGFAARLRSWILPGEAERDPDFRREIQRLSVRALLIIAGVNGVMPLVAVLFDSIVQLIEPRPMSAYWTVPASFLIAGTVFALSRIEWGRRRARLLALSSGWLTAMVLTWGQYLSGAAPAEAQLSSVINVSVVMLVGVAAVPARPLQMLALGVAINTSHFASANWALRKGLIPEVSIHEYAGMDLFALLCAALSAVLYQRLLEQYHARTAQLEAQSQLLISESAASMGRFAATLTHELNSPLGTLASSIDSLGRVERRLQASSPEQTARLRAVASDLLATAGSAADSLRSTARRIERFTNLDRAEVTSVDLRQLLHDVTAMIEPELGPRVHVEVECSPIPPLTLRPQQMSAVFARLLRYAAEAGGDDGHVTVSSCRVNGHAEIVIRHQGPGLSAKEAATLFEPSFRVQGSRVRGSNWTLFNARQAVREHGGDIGAQSSPGMGTKLTVRLPL